MLEKLTIKDFIKYNSPCKCCDDIPECILKICSTVDARFDYDNEVTEFPIDIVQGAIEVPISISYSGKKSILIDPVTNSYIHRPQTSKSKQMFIVNFLDKNICWLESHCKKCNTKISSNNLEFKDNYIEPLSLMFESTFLNSGTHKYSMVTYFPSDEDYGGRTDILFCGLTEYFDFDERYLFDVASDNRMTVDAMPIGKFKNKEDILSKLEMLITFR